MKHTAVKLESFECYEFDEDSESIEVFLFIKYNEFVRDFIQ